MFDQLYTFMGDAARWLDSMSQDSLEVVLIVIMSPAITTVPAALELRASLSWREPPRHGVHRVAFRMIRSVPGATAIAAGLVLIMAWCALLLMLRIVTAMELDDLELGVSQGLALARRNLSPIETLTFLPPAFMAFSMWGLYLLPRAHRHCASLVPKANG